MLFSQLTCPGSSATFCQEIAKGIIFNLIDYLDLVDWTDRQIREDKIGSISAEANAANSAK